jgi:hypothetical protein
MIDLFGRKRRQELFDRAYAEFVSGNYVITEKNLSQLIKEGSNNFYVFNLRAQTYLGLNKLHLAFRDALTSTQLEANIEKNKDAYDIRNFITSQLKSGVIQVDLFELLKFFNIENVIQLYIDSIFIGLNLIENKYGTKLSSNPISNKQRMKFIALNYLKWSCSYQIKHPQKQTYDRENLKILRSRIKNVIDNSYLEFSSNSRDMMAMNKLTIQLNIDEHHLWVSYINRKEIDDIRDYILDEIYSKDHSKDALILSFLHYLEYHIIQDPFGLKTF